MNKKLTTFLFIIIIIMASHSFVYAQSRAIIKQISGKVEVKLPNRDWQGAWVGLVMAKGTIVSTGYNSSTVIEMDGSVLTVKALSRLTLEELFREGDEINTRVYLRSGRIESNVDTTQGLKHNYRLRSPITTASVRGCVFTFSVKKLFVKEGTVILYNLLNRGGTAGEGEGVWTTTGLDMHTAEEDATKQAEVDIITSTEPFRWYINRWFVWVNWFRPGGEASNRRTPSAIVYFYLVW
ncbi:MAG: FecR domain-containing protein [Spirochaetales bacterium]|nr:FecR domain-containing protein [Spirochaetales bacterium]